MMKKCEFCVAVKQNGTCPYETQIGKEDDCKRAIKNMVAALSSKPEKKRKFFNLS